LNIVSVILKVLYFIVIPHTVHIYEFSAVHVILVTLTKKAKKCKVYAVVGKVAATPLLSYVTSYYL
jgi:hypothetical protein